MNLVFAIGPVEFSIAKIALMAALAGTSVLAVTRTAAVYHDGLRTSVPEKWRDGRSGRSLASYSYSISIGFIVAYALPYSLATGIIIIHIILLAADGIGFWFERPWQAVAVGVAYGAGVTVAIDAVVAGFQQIASYGPALEPLFAPLAYTFPLLAAVAVANQFGLRWGLFSAVVTLAVWKAAEVIRDAGELQAPLTPTGGAIALGVATLLLVIQALRTSTPAAADTSTYEEGIQRMRGLWPYLVAPPVLLAVGASQGWLAGEPLQLVMVAVGSLPAAASVAFFSAVGFLPMIALSGLISGVWNQDGYPDWYLGAGYLAGHPALAALGGLALILAELGSLRWAGRLLTTRPQIHGIGSAARDALDVVPTLSILAGAVFASVSIAGPLGAAVVIVAHAFNDAKGRPVMPLAMPMFAFLAVALGAEAIEAMGLS